MPPDRPRSDRVRELVAATRALFDERGRQDAPIEEIARAVGIARGLVYRHFSSKDELYILTVTDYLREIRSVLTDADDPSAPPDQRLRDCVAAYARYCLRYPAYMDVSLSLMQAPVQQLRERVSESVWLQLGMAMSASIDQVTSIIRDGLDVGAFDLTDADYVASVIWTQTLGTMHLARLGVGVKRGAGDFPELFAVDPDRVIDTCVSTALSAARRTL